MRGFRDPRSSEERDKVSFLQMLLAGGGFNSSPGSPFPASATLSEAHSGRGDKVAGREGGLAAEGTSGQKPLCWKDHFGRPEKVFWSGCSKKISSLNSVETTRG